MVIEDRKKSFKKNLPLNARISSTNQMMQFEYSMKDFLRLNLVLSTEKIDENDDPESLIENLNNTKNSPKKSIIPKPTSLDQSFNTSLLYVKSIKKFDTNEETEKNLQPNDLIIKINEQVVSTLEEFKLMLYNLNKIFLATNTPQIICLTVKRRSRAKTESIKEEENILSSRDSQAMHENLSNKLSASQNTSNFISFEKETQSQASSQHQLNSNDLNADVNKTTIASSNRHVNIDSLNDTNNIQNFLMWFTSTNYAQYFFPLYSHDNVITEEYLQAYNMFKNLDVPRLENLFEAFKVKILSKTQDYIQEFKVS